MVAAHEDLSAEERELIDDVFEAGERQLREVMVPRTEVEFLDASWPLAKAVRIVSELPHSRYPVFRVSADEVVGFVHFRDILLADRSGGTDRIGALMREVAMFPGSKRVIPALSEMRRDGHHLAVVVDEYGGTAGIVTLEDLVEELVGDIRDEYDDDEGASRRFGEVLEVDGLINIEDFEEETGVTLPEGPYETAAGFVVAALGTLPVPGVQVEVDGHRLTVLELDGRRIARLRVEPLPPNGGDDEAPPVGPVVDPAAGVAPVPGMEQ
jgi:putative hemolysin